MSANYNRVKHVQNTKFTFCVESWKDKDGVLIPLTNMKAVWNFIYRDWDGEIAMTLTTENGGIVIDTATSSITVTMTTAQARTVRYDILVYELELIDSTNETIPFLRGTVKYEKGN
jgi:hypothetical protein